MTGIQFNETKETVAERTESTNYEGGESYDPDSAELELTKNVLNNLFEDSFYESADQSMQDVVSAFERVVKTNPEYVLKLAVYARETENLRQVPQFLLVLAANHDAYRETGLVRAYAPRIMSRADEPLEALAMQKTLFGKTIPHSLKKGMEDAMHNYNEYQYAKWDRPSREWQYKDLMNLVHPRPRDDEREAIFQKIALGELDSHEEVEPLKQENTWEDEMSEAGKNDDMSKAEVWREQLKENDDGYSMPIFARVRNTRNMLQEGITGDEIYNGEIGPAVTDEWVRNSGMWPFRFYQAYKAIKEDRDTPNDRAALQALNDAMEVAAENLPDYFDSTFTAMDTSGSMTWGSISEHSTITPLEIGSLLASLTATRGCEVGGFDSDFRYYSLDPLDSVVTNTERIMNGKTGGATYGHKVFDQLTADGKKYDRIILITDMQIYGQSMRDSWQTYRREVNPEANLYIVDVQSYGDLVTAETDPGVYNIQGWSEQVLKFIDQMENIDGLVQEIESIEP